MAVDPVLLEILACPDDKGPLYYVADEDVLYNPRLHRRYAVRDGIPVMLVDESVIVDDAEHARLRARIDSEGIVPTGSGGAGPGGPGSGGAGPGGVPA